MSVKDLLLDKLPKWLEEKIADYRTSVEMYRFQQSKAPGKITYQQIADMYQTSPQNVHGRILTVKKHLEELKKGEG